MIRLQTPRESLSQQPTRAISCASDQLQVQLGYSSTTWSRMQCVVTPRAYAWWTRVARRSRGEWKKEPRMRWLPSGNRPMADFLVTLFFSSAQQSIPSPNHSDYHVSRVGQVNHRIIHAKVISSRAIIYNTHTRSVHRW